MRLLLSAFFISVLSFAQQSNCVLAEHNEVFRNTIKTAENLNAQLELIKSKVIFDADFIEKDTIWNNTYLADRVHISETSSLPPLICIFSKTMVQDNEGNSCPNKIVFLISTKRGLYPLDLNKDPELINIINEFSTENVFKIYLYLDNNESIFGTKATEGAVIIKITDNEIRRKLRKYFRKKQKSH